MELPSPWLPRTKLKPPRLRDDVLSRPRVLALLSRALASSSITLVSAPAGYGKTTLLVSWLQSPEREPRLPVAWLTLDAADDEPQLFLSALLAALQSLDPAFGSTAHLALAGPPGEPLSVPRIVGLLINEMLARLPDPFVLVLDDLHAIADPAIFAALEYLIEHQPEQMRTVIMTREEPPLALERLRARGRLAELRLPELCFTLDEADDLLGDCFKLALTPDELRLLVTQTEGWAAALRLIAASLAARSADERAAVIERLPSTSRHVFNLLAVEVLDRQPPAIRRFLLETSILDVLSPELCMAVTGEPDAPLLLEEVYRRNLFLVAIDNSDALDTSYRYHALFLSFLRRRLAEERPSDRPVLHRRAAAASPTPAQAVPHFLAARAWHDAAVALEGVAEELFNHGQLVRLRGWIDALPPAVRTEHPWLIYFQGACAWGQSRFDEARTVLDAALAGFAARGDHAGRGEALVLLGTLHQTAGAFELARAAYHEAQPFPISQRSRAQLHMGLAWLALGLGDDAAVGENLAAALDLVKHVGDAGAQQIVAMQLREVFGVVAAGRHAMARACGLPIAEGPELHAPRMASLHAWRAVLSFWQGDLDQAVQHTDAALALSGRLGAPPWLHNSFDLFRLTIYARAGMSAKAWAALDELRDSLPVLPGWYAARALWIGYVLLDRGDIAALRALETEMSAHASPTEWPVSRAARQILRGVLAARDRQFGEAETALLAAQALQQRWSLCRMLGDVDLLLSGLYLRWRRIEPARRSLQQALRRWRETDLPGLHLVIGSALLRPPLEFAIKEQIEAEWAVRVLDLLCGGAARHVVIPETGSTLTPREAEVLRLLAGGAGNQAIAAALAVSLPTVKTHVSRILSKLGVTTRGEAVARAHSLRLL